jgi:LacI family transcriptional regulator
MAIAAIKVIQESGLRVPEDIAVVGFDDIEYAALLSPQLTTMRQDCGGLGAAAVEALLRMLTRPDKTPQEVVLPVELVVRESCGARTPMATAS